MTPTINPKIFVQDLPTPEPESPCRPRQPYRFSTLCATVENPSQKDQYGSSSVPIYQTSTFKGINGQYDYSRSGNPTRSHLEHHLAKISSATHALTVSSGMAALDTILRMLKPGDEVIAGDDLYGGTNRILTYLKTHGGITVHHVDTTKPDTLLPHVNPEKTAMVLLESPTNPLLKIVDLARIAADIKERAPNAVIVVDNTMMSPYLQRPLEHGADIVYDSATKYLSGHHDLMAGVITCNRDDLAKQMSFIVNAAGNALTPFDCFLLLRGSKTLAIRMDRQQATSMLVAQMLDRLGFKVHYPGLADHPNRDVHERIADGYGAVLSFTTGDKAVSERIVAATRLWGISVSFGCVNSLISMPCVMSHASIDPATRAERGLPEDLIRLCVGIEDPADLLDDLERALLEAGAITLTAGADSHQRYVRTIPSEGTAISRAVQKLAFNESAGHATELDNEEREWFVSAPGKVILFGEHAVVHGVTAVAASVDLRCYGVTNPRHDGKVSVHYIDIDNFTQEWEVDDLPWDAVTPVRVGDAHPDSLDHKLVDAITTRALSPEVLANPSARQACVAFLYMYMIMAQRGIRPSFNFSARATLPVGAGLGSSASFSACAATALLLLHSRIQLPAQPAPTTAGHIHISHQGRRAIPPAIAEEVNRWAFVSEKILHGNPSGVDNSVAVFGGALSYTRAGFGRKSGMIPIQGFKSLKFLLTDSRVPRNTKQLVAGVAALKEQEPEFVDGLLNAIQSISDEAQRALADPNLSRETLLSALSALIDENHGHLVKLGVSHPSLEAIRSKTASPPYALSTKLTGAGGGGCAVTLVPDNLSESSLRELMAALSTNSFVPYLTSVGGSGLGILSPYNQPQRLATPPETPPEGADDAGVVELLRDTFAGKATAELSGWADGLGRWLFV
ncbi:Cys/Met metabolism PLP-dependent enzyme-domain-containing protein [Suillus paluster]|uniref:Cys/Met metabolism PLP-dependent enzyme-domain-containing protein n=1 Tax=Suillus paluster TaxID=48578 RepID=UPI001B885A45|nr:Cys/Met metabolism PLP-dependent enzyme-domain-containing protein [Suillus paluster]KAG1747094.1 Cys/Met metabolism PLP-dependent enzyme-domain-containing protein [Suillus paluster]